MNTDFYEFLTEKQQVFCNEYLVDMNATRAALKAGYSAATALNGQLMRMPKIKLYLQQRVDAAAKRMAIDHDKVLQELGKIAFMNMGNYFGPNGEVKPIKDLSPDDMAAVQSLSISPDGTVKIRLCNKLAAIERIAKHINFYKTDDRPTAPTHVYLEESHMTDDDRFDDEQLRRELSAAEEQARVTREQAALRALQQEEKASIKKLEAEAAELPVQVAEPGPAQNANREEVLATVDQAAALADKETGPAEDGMPPADQMPVIFDGAGIPYEQEGRVKNAAEKAAELTYIDFLPAGVGYPTKISNLTIAPPGRNRSLWNTQFRR